MTSCRACGAPILWVIPADPIRDGPRIAVDGHEVLGGDFQLRDDGVVVRVEPSDRRTAYRKHLCAGR